MKDATLDSKYLEWIGRYSQKRDEVSVILHGNNFN